MATESWIWPINYADPLNDCIKCAAAVLVWARREFSYVSENQLSEAFK